MQQGNSMPSSSITTSNSSSDSALHDTNIFLAKIKDLEAQLHQAHLVINKLRWPALSFSNLPLELQDLVWEYTLPAQRVITSRLVRKNDDSWGYFFYSTRPPLALQICQRSRTIALEHFKQFFQGSDKLSRPIYFRPKVDILFLDEMDGTGHFAAKYPETSEIHTIAISDACTASTIFGPSRTQDTFTCNQGLKLLLAVSRDRPPNLQHGGLYCCATVKLSVDHRRESQQWKDDIIAERDRQQRTFEVTSLPT
jgi:hypothetical protein